MILYMEWVTIYGMGFYIWKGFPYRNYIENETGMTFPYRKPFPDPETHSIRHLNVLTILDDLLRVLEPAV